MDYFSTWQIFLYGVIFGATAVIVAKILKNY